MSTTTVRLDPEDERLLDALAALYGGRSGALKEGLRLLAAESARRQALDDLLHEWEPDGGQIGEDAVQTMIKRYEL